MTALPFSYQGSDSGNVALSLADPTGVQHALWWLSCRDEDPMTIAHILLLPHESTRAALLAPGAPVCCRSPAWVFAFGWSCGGGFAHWEDDGDTTLESAGDWPDCHLVLARDGAVVLEGSDRFARTRDWNAGEVEGAIRLALRLAINSAVHLNALRKYTSAVGTLVLIDADGREVSS